MGTRDARNVDVMITTLLLATTLFAASPDTTKHAAIPRRDVVMQDTARDDDTHDRWFGEDKLKHMSMSYVITVVGYAGMRTMSGHDPSEKAALVGGALAGLLKETYDKRHARPFSGRDLLWDAIGVAAGYAMVSKTK